MNLKVKKTRRNGSINSPAKEGDAGYDVYATEGILLSPGQRFKMPLGIAIEIPIGYVAIVQGKSGRAAKEGLTTIGNVIDSGYRGEVHANLLNAGEEQVNIGSGEKVAQIIFQKCYTPKIEFVADLSESERGEGGFGSTGLESTAPIPKERKKTAMEIIIEDAKARNEGLKRIADNKITLPFNPFRDFAEELFKKIDEVKVEKEEAFELASEKLNGFDVFIIGVKDE